MGILKDLYILGAGGFGREVAWLVERINEVETVWNLKGFLDDNEAVQGTLQGGYPVVGGCSYLADVLRETWVICAVGCTKARKKLVEKVNQYEKVRFATLVDTGVVCSKRVSVGEGSIICAGTVLTVDISIGNHVIINLDCTVGHDVRIEDYVTLYPSVNVSGGAVIGECVELGTGMQVLQGKRICEGSVVGAGAVVVKDVEEKGTYVGVPVKKMV